MILKHLIEGWKNHLLPNEVEAKIIEQVSKERMSICDSCSYHSKNHKTIRPDAHCTHCGCTLIAKTKCLSCECPLEDPSWTEFLEN